VSATYQSILRILIYSVLFNQAQFKIKSRFIKNTRYIDGSIEVRIIEILIKHNFLNG